MFRRRYQRRRFGLRSFRRRPILRHSSWRRKYGAATKSYRRRFVRRSYKRRTFIKRRRYHKRSHNSFAKKVLKAVVPMRTAQAVYQQEHTVPSLTTGLIPAVYFACEFYDAAATKDTVRTVELFDVKHLGTLFDLSQTSKASEAQTGAVSDSAAMFSSNRQKLWVNGVMTQVLRNQCTEPVLLTAYFCRPRQNLNFSDATTTPTVYQWLSYGFANNGLGPNSVTPAGNPYMQSQEYSPFQSLDFVRDFKITRVKKIKIQPGQFKKLVIRNRRGFITHPHHLFVPSGTTDQTSWNSEAPKYQFIKQSRFILYKLQSSIGGYGGLEQLTYTKLTQTTTPTVIMRTNFLYKFRAQYERFSPAATIEFSGIANNGATASAIVVPDAASVGVVSHAY
jgi:hypothetical protein